jgi:hypothetical protein
VERRLALLDDLIERHEATARKLMLELLPEAHEVGFPTQAPKFRTWKPPDEPRVTVAEYWSFTDSVVDRLLRQVGEKPDRWVQLIDQLSSMSPPQREKVRRQLGEAANAMPDTLVPAERWRLWEGLDNLVRRHRTYANTRWALPEAELELLAEISQKFKPVEPIERHRWLFNEHAPDLGTGTRADFLEYQETVLRARAEAAGEILSSEGPDGVIELAKECELPSALGFALAEAGPDVDDNQIITLLDNPEPKLVDFARGYVTRRLRPGGGQ